MPRTATKPKVDVVWKGAEALRPFLVPIDSLEPFPGNPRRGDVEALRESLKRFGQTQAVLVDGSGTRIVARHHVTLAAGEEGWTHVAAIPNEFESEEEAKAYLVADNRLHDRGGYDSAQLLEHLKALQAAERLDGTGYADAHVAQLERDLARAAAAATPPVEFPSLDPNAIHVDYQCPSCGHGWSGHPRPGA